MIWHGIYIRLNSGLSAKFYFGALCKTTGLNLENIFGTKLELELSYFIAMSARTNELYQDRRSENELVTLLDNIRWTIDYGTATNDVKSSYSKTTRTCSI